VLSELQLRVARLVAQLPEAESFALAGGGALIVRGDVERQTRDLDFFGPSIDAVDALVPAVEKALRRDGIAVERVLDGRGFTRLLAEAGGERTELDLGNDARMFPTEFSGDIPVLSGEELAVDKVLAVFGRAEPRDFSDLGAIAGRFGVAHLFHLASKKDRGFDARVFAQMANRFDRLPREEFQLDDGQYVELSQFVASWSVSALEFANQYERSRDRDPGLER
jgi:hypothetical protein